MEWMRLIPELRRLGLFTVVDRAALESYCVAYSHWRGAEIDLKKDGRISTNRFGERVVSPAYSISHRAMDIMRRISVEFGFTPVSRSRVTTGGKEADPDEGFFGKKGGGVPRKKLAVFQ